MEEKKISKTLVRHILDETVAAGHQKDELYQNLVRTSVAQEHVLDNMGMERFNVIENLFFCPIIQLMVDSDFTKEEVLDHISNLIDTFIEKRSEVISMQDRLKEKQKEIDAIYEEYGFKRN